MKPDISTLKEEEILPLFFACLKKIDINNMEKYLDLRYDRYEENRQNKVGVIINAIDTIKEDDIISYINEKLKGFDDKKLGMNKIGDEFKRTHNIYEKFQNTFQAYEQEFRKQFPVDISYHGEDDLVDTAMALKILEVVERTFTEYKREEKVKAIERKNGKDYFRVGDLRELKRRK